MEHGEGRPSTPRSLLPARKGERCPLPLPLVVGVGRGQRPGLLALIVSQLSASRGDVSARWEPGDLFGDARLRSCEQEEWGGGTLVEQGHFSLCHWQATYL